VEVFLGGTTGEQTVGARSQKGVISIHDSYKYTSTKYEITRFHFRSIEPWLCGELIPLHPEHWLQRDAFVSGVVGVDNKRSIFNDACSEEGDEGSGCEDIEKENSV